MSKTGKTLICAAGVILGAGTFLIAQTDSKAKKGGGGRILQPQMTVETGSYAKPAGTVGQKPAQPWTATTVAAGVDGKPLPGKVATLTGEIIDFSCYLQLGKHGEKHRTCGQGCARNGQPIGLLTENGEMYMLMAEEHDPRRDGLTDFQRAGVEHMGHIMQVTGTASMHNGYRALYVQGFLKK
jgi:hypothetical protein